MRFPMDTRLSTRAERTQPVIVADPPVTGERSLLGYPGVALAGILLGVSTLAFSSLPPKLLPLFLLGALFPFLGVIFGDVRKLLLAAIILDIPLKIDINFNYLEDRAELGAIGGFEISLTTLALAGLYAGWLVESLTRRDRPAAPPFQLIRPLAVYVLFVALSVVTAQDFGLYARGLFLILQIFLLFVYLVGWVRTTQDVRFIVTMLLCGLVLESAIIIGFGQSAESFELAGVRILVNTATEDLGGSRFYGTLGSPINTAAYLSMLLAPAVGLLATNIGRPSKMLAVAGIALGSVALIGTLSRAAWASAGVSMAVTCLAFRRRGSVPVAVPFLLLVFVAAVSLNFQGTIATRLTSDDQGSARGRVPLMMTALDIIGDNPVLGIGANNYTAALKRYESTFKGDWLFTVHNKYLLVWAETGIVGLAAFLWFLIATIRQGWRQWKRSDPLLSPLALGFTAAIVGQMGHMFVDIFSSRPQIQLLWVVAALIAVMSPMESPHLRRDTGG